MIERAELVVLGGGMAGLSVSYHLARLGLKALVLEQEASFDVHSSGRNASIFRHVEGDPGIARLAQRSKKHFDLIFSASEQAWLKPTGANYISDSEHEIQALVETARIANVPFERLSKKRLDQRGFASTINDGIHVSSDGIMDGHAMLTALKRLGHALGVEYRQQTAVVEARQESSGSGFVLRLGNGHEIRAAQLVVCSGAWAMKHSVSLKTPMPLKPLRRHLVLLQVPKSTVPEEVFWRVGRDACYFRPETNKVLFSPCDEAAFEPESLMKDPEALSWVHEKIQRTFPAFGEAQVVTYWAGLRTFAPDRKPVLGPDPKIPGLHWLVGLGGHGMTVGSAAGETVAAAIDGDATLLNPAYLPDRFSGNDWGALGHGPTGPAELPATA